MRFRDLTRLEGIMPALRVESRGWAFTVMKLLRRGKGKLLLSNLSGRGD